MTETATKPRLKTRYAGGDPAPALSTQFSHGNAMQVPGVVKVVVNMGVGDGPVTQPIDRGRDPRSRRDHRARSPR